MKERPILIVMVREPSWVDGCHQAYLAFPQVTFQTIIEAFDNIAWFPNAALSSMQYLYTLPMN